MQKLQTVNADTLLYEPLEKPFFVVDGLIPTGLTLFCGSQKIGKSWLMLKLCLCVSQGLPLWDMPTLEGDVLYLCLEDIFCRIQDRLFKLTDEASGRLRFAVASCKLPDGLIVQLEDYLKEYPDSRLIVIDTLQKVRTASKDNAYAKTKDKAEQGYYAEEGAATEYAADKVSHASGCMTEEGINQFNKHGQKRVKTTQENIVKAKDKIADFKQKRAAKAAEQKKAQAAAERNSLQIRHGTQAVLLPLLLPRVGTAH